VTHTLHRIGTADGLSGDYVILCMRAAGINDVGSDAKLQEFLRIATDHDPKNIGSVRMNMFSHKPAEVIANAHSIAHAVFDNQQAVTQVLRELKQADLGLSIVVSGVLDSVNECCQQAGLKRHTVEFSLGIWGMTDKLPSNEVLEVTTMCGHAMVSAKLVESIVADIRKGAKNPDGAAKELASHCCCGVFNPARAARLLAEMAGPDINP
jgi:hypothetical protein